MCCARDALKIRYIFCCKWNLPVVSGSCVALKRCEKRQRVKRNLPSVHGHRIWDYGYSTVIQLKTGLIYFLVQSK